MDRVEVGNAELGLLLVGVAFGLRLGAADGRRLERHLRVFLGGLLHTHDNVEPGAH